MKLGIYAIYDRKSMSYGTLFTHENNDTANRYFQHLCSLPGNEVIRDDVSLYRLGSFNSFSGKIEDVIEEYVSDFVYTSSIRDQIRHEILMEMMNKNDFNKKEVDEDER